MVRSDAYPTCCMSCRRLVQSTACAARSSMLRATSSGSPLAITRRKSDAMVSNQEINASLPCCVRGPKGSKNSPNELVFGSGSGSGGMGSVVVDRVLATMACCWKRLPGRTMFEPGRLWKHRGPDRPWLLSPTLLSLMPRRPSVSPADGLGFPVHPALSKASGFSRQRSAHLIRDTCLSMPALATGPMSRRASARDRDRPQSER